VANMIGSHGGHGVWHILKAGGWIAGIFLIAAGLLAFNINPVNHSPGDCLGLHIPTSGLIKAQSHCPTEFDEARFVVDALITLGAGLIGMAIAQALVDTGVADKDSLGISD
jgi:hypothetical protein